MSTMTDSATTNTNPTTTPPVSAQSRALWVAYTLLGAIPAVAGLASLPYVSEHVLWKPGDDSAFAFDGVLTRRFLIAVGVSAAIYVACYLLKRAADMRTVGGVSKYILPAGPWERALVYGLAYVALALAAFYAAANTPATNPGWSRMCLLFAGLLALTLLPASLMYMRGLVGERWGSRQMLVTLVERLALGFVLLAAYAKTPSTGQGDNPTFALCVSAVAGIAGYVVISTRMHALPYAGDSAPETFSGRLSKRLATAIYGEMPLQESRRKARVIGRIVAVVRVILFIGLVLVLSHFFTIV